MKADNRKMREWLENCSRKQFVTMVHELMLNDYDKKLLIMKKQKFSNTKISLKLHKDNSIISKELAKLYQRMYSLLG